MAKTTKRKTNNPNHDYVPPHSFGGIICAELSDALDMIFSPQKPAEMKAKECLKPLNCPNCGAPVRWAECEYCGTVFERNSGYEEYDIEVHFANNADSVASYIRRFNSATGTYEWVDKNHV